MRTDNIAITEELVSKIIQTVDAGLCRGMGDPEPGKMCVEAAVNYAMGLPHGDNPSCVSPAVRALKIRLNDSDWSNDTARAKGLRRLAIAQLGTAEGFDQVEFAIRVALIGYSEPPFVEWANGWLAGGRDKKAAEAAAWAAAEAAEAAAEAAAWAAKVAAEAAAWAAKAAAEAAAWAEAAAEAAEAAAWAAWAAKAAAEAAAAWAAVGDESLSEFAEKVVQILVTMKTPGSEFLYLTE